MIGWWIAVAVGLIYLAIGIRFAWRWVRVARMFGRTFLGRKTTPEISAVGWSLLFLAVALAWPYWMGYMHGASREK